MTQELSLRTAELLTSRLCHDLITPIGAINTGLELFQETPPDNITESQEILNLILHSAQAAAARVSFFRLAFGASGRKVSLEELRELAENYFLRTKIKIIWKEPFHKDATLEEGSRLLLNAILWLGECAPRGGTISVTIPKEDKPSLSLALKADSIILHQGTVEALEGKVPFEDLTPRIVPCYLIHCLINEIKGELTFRNSASPSELFLEIKGQGL
jgi:histidine phosphotransferase ChpT